MITIFALFTFFATHLLTPSQTIQHAGFYNNHKINPLINNHNNNPFNNNHNNNPLNNNHNNNHINNPFKNNPQNILMVMDTVVNRDSLTEHHQRMIKQQHRDPDSRYNINVTRSDLTPLDRPITDTLPPICKTFQYDHASLPKVSVVIPFYNEALSMLLRAVHSLLNRSPDVLLEEVILVDDHSPDLHLQGPLAAYVELLPKVKLVRNKERKGLIVGRMKGAAMARGEVIVFLDAHTEVNDMWLEPLLREIQRDRRQVLQPFVDAIDAMTIEIFKPGAFHKGSFSWDLRYTWTKLTEHEQQEAYETGLPFPSPTLVGCAIVVEKKYFEEIGAFDEGMKVWGGENIELAFRTWMCGGKVQTVTCSHVGHVFKEFPYSFDGDKDTIVQKNLIRVVETWMGGTKKFFYASTFVFPHKRTQLNEAEMESLQERKLIRQRLSCKNFEWYLYNITPQLQLPSMEDVLYGEITNHKSRLCWEMTEDYLVALTFVCYHHKIIPSNYFSISKDGILRHRDKCILVSPEDSILRLDECPWGLNEIEKYGVWSIQPTESIVHGLLQVKVKLNNHSFKRFCIEQVTNAMPHHHDRQMPQLSRCDKENHFQLWSFTYAFDFSLVPSGAFDLSA